MHYCNQSPEWEKNCPTDRFCTEWDGLGGDVISAESLPEDILCVGGRPECGHYHDSQMCVEK